MSEIMKNLKTFKSLKKNNNSLDKLFGEIKSFANQLKCDANYDLCLNSVKMRKTIDEFNESENYKRFKCFCPKCEFSTKNECHLNEHIVIHSNKKRFVCEFNGCNKAFKQKPNYIRHKRTHNTTEKNKLKCFCPNCKFMTYNQGTLKRHKTIHLNKKQYICDFSECSFSTKDKNELDDHKLKHSNASKFICDFEDCNKTFKYKSNQNRHKQSHNEKKFFKCDFKDCDKTYPYLKSLKLHKNSIHLNIRYRCHFNNCNKTFSSKSNLIEHKRIHSGEKPFKCYINGCDK